MMNELIHHYTSIENLSLILKSKKIRFSRIDKVDDLSEIDGLPRSFNTYTFISCWTDQIEESIPLWKMYTQNLRGIRISLPINMFKKKIIKAGFYGFNNYLEDIIAPLSSSELVTDSYCVVNNFKSNLDFFCKVQYKDNYADYNKTIYQVDDNGRAILNAMFMIGLYKKNIWQFQNECRFKLNILPKLKIFDPEIELVSINSALLNNIPNKFDFFDLELDSSILDNITLRLGPLCSLADEIIVDSLLKLYTSNGSYYPSELTGILRK